MTEAASILHPHQRFAGMNSSIRRTLWGAFTILSTLILLGLTLTLAVLQSERNHQHQAVHGSQPILANVAAMDAALIQLASAARG